MKRLRRYPAAAVAVVVALVVLAVFVIASRGGGTSRPAIIHPPVHRGPIVVPAALRALATNGTLITPGQADALVRAWWPLEETALAQNDATVTDAIETGPAAEFNDSVTFDNLLRGGNLRRSRPLKDVKVIVPALRDYPAYFFAEVLTTTYAGAGLPAKQQPPYQEYLVFVRPDAATPWKAALDTGGNVGSWPPFAPSPAAGTEYAETPTGTYEVDPTTLPTSVATYKTQYLQQLGRPRLLGILLKPNFWSDTELKQASALVVQERQHDLIDLWSFSADTHRDGFYQFALDDGSDLVCFTTRTNRSLGELGAPLVQDQNRDNWGGWLKPGRYQDIEIRGLQQSCALDPAQGGGQLELYGSNGGIVGVAGSPPS